MRPLLSPKTPRDGEEVAAVRPSPARERRPTWAQVVRRSVLAGLIAAAGGLLWYYLPDRWIPVYALTLAVGAAVLMVRADRTLWNRDPAAFWKKNGVTALGIGIFGAGSFWWTAAGSTELSDLEGARYLVLIGIIVTTVGSLLTDLIGDGSGGEPSRVKLSSAKMATAFVLFWAAFVGLVFMVEWTANPDPLAPPPW